MKWALVGLVCVLSAAYLLWPRDEPVAVVAETAPETEGPPPIDASWLAEHDNVTFGKVQAGSASTAETEAYFAQRQKISEDAIAFCARTLDRFGARMSEEQRGLYALAIRMHKTRIAEIPRRKAEAIARAAEQDRKRAEWKALNGGH